MTTNCTRRNASTIALQSLSLLNSDFVTARAQAMAARLQRSAGDDSAAKIAQAFLLAYSRLPTAEEAAAAAQFIDTQPKNYPDQPDAAPLRVARLLPNATGQQRVFVRRIRKFTTEPRRWEKAEFRHSSLPLSVPPCLVCCQRYQKRVC